MIQKMYKQMELSEILAGGLLSWSTVLGIMLRRNIHLGIMVWLFSVVIAIIFTPIIIAILRFIGRNMVQLNTIKGINEKLSDRKIFLLIMIILLICWFPYFLAYYPGIFAYDVGNQMEQITTASYHTKHPLLHTFLIQIFYSLGDLIHSYTIGIALYNLFQMILLAGIISYSYLNLYQMGIGKVIRYIILIYYALFPVHAMLSISVTKDIIFSGFVLLFSVLYYRKVVKDKGNIIGYAALIMISVIMCLFRNNAIYAFFLSGFVNLFIYMRDRNKAKKIGSIWIVVLILYFVSNVFLIRITNAQQGSIRESLSVPFQQISRTYNMHMEELSEEERKEIEELIPGVLEYNPVIADPVKSSAEVRHNEKRIIQLWARLLPQYFDTYVEAFLYNSYGSWFIDDTSNAYVYDNPGETRRGYLISGCNTDYGVEHTSYFSNLEKNCEKLFSYNDYQKIPIIRIVFAPALYFWIISITAIYALCRKKSGVLTSITFLLVYHFTIMCGPCCLVRYMYPLMITMPFVVGVYLQEKPAGDRGKL